MLDADWYETSQAVEPARINLLSNENRMVGVSLAKAVASGETLQATGITTTLTRYGKTDDYPDAINGAVSYVAATKTAWQKIDASKLPLDTPIALKVSFNVTMTSPAGTDRRTVLLVIVVRA
jgi:hypothetical protein